MNPTREPRSQTKRAKQLRAARARYEKKQDPNRKRQRDANRHARTAADQKKHTTVTPLGLSIDSLNPRYLWIDKDGNLHIEEELSAEELIRRWQEGHQ